MTERRYIEKSVHIAMALVFAVLATGCASAVPDVTPNAPVVPGSHGMPADRLDWDEVGLPLDEAIVKSGLKVTLLDSVAIGKPTKVVLDETSGGGGGRTGLMILYSSGVKLKIAPTETDLHAVATRPGASTFTDGRQTPFSEALVNGRPALLLREGAQRGAHGITPVTALTIWNTDGCTYRLESASSDVTLELLKAMAEAFPAP